MPPDITLTSALRTNLQSLQKTKGAGARHEDAVAESPAATTPGTAAQDFCTQTLGAHASALTARLDDLSKSIKMLETASQEVTELLRLLTNAELVALAAQDALDADENADITKFGKTLETLTEQAGAILQNSAYEKIVEDSTLSAKGVRLEAVSLSSPSSIADSVDIIRDILDEAQSLRATVADDFNDVQARQDFTKGTINALEAGEKEINITALHEEGANLLALQTRMALGETSSSLASPTQEDVLRLF